MKNKPSKVSEFKKILSKEELLYLPGQLAFSLVFAIVPTVSIIVALVSKVNISTNFIYNFLSTYFSVPTADYIVDMISSSSFTITNVIAFIIAFYISSHGFNAVIVISDKMYKIKSTDLLKRKIKSFVLNLFFFLLILFILLVPVFGKIIIRTLSFVIKDVSIIKIITTVVGYLKWPATFIIILFFVKLMYGLSPNKVIPGKYLNRGSLFTTLGFMIVSFIYSFYVNNIARYDLLYGNFANLIVLLLWFYLISYIFVLGLAINENDYKGFKSK